MRTLRRTLAHLIPMLLLPGCPGSTYDLGEVDDTGTSGNADGSGETGSGPSDGGSESGGPTPACGEPGYVPTCADDEDHDGIVVCEDVSPDFFDPMQLDHDADGFGDAIDLCPTIASENNTADSDRDGIGNACDRCPSTTTQYNEGADALGLPYFMRVRNIPTQSDADGDGVGDACDNCPTIPNCGSYGPDNPHVVGDPLDLDDDVCQRDDDANLVGDACDGTMAPGAAGPVGLGDDDDFDQDGLRNIDDGCPRLPVAGVACQTDADCPAQSLCAGTGVCNHPDADADDVGDACDTCPTTPNGMQVVEGGAQQDDEDGDFVGWACEPYPSCSVLASPRRVGFYPVSAEGWCCTVATQYGPPMIVDPDGLPVTAECTIEQQEAHMCRRFPTGVLETPGLLALPPGCDAALAEAGSTVSTNQPLTEADVGGDLGKLYDHACWLPPADQDLDGLGDTCDLCPFAFDPENQPYIDEDGKLWPGSGKYCNGEYSPDAVCSD